MQKFLISHHVVEIDMFFGYETVVISQNEEILYLKKQSSENIIMSSATDATTKKLITIFVNIG